MSLLRKSSKLPDYCKTILIPNRTPPPLSEGFVHPLSLPLRATPLEKLGNRAAALALGDKVLELGVVIRVGLHSHLEGDALPVGVHLLAPNQRSRGQVSVH